MLLLPEVMSRSIAQLQPGTVVKSVVQLATRANTKAWDLG